MEIVLRRPSKEEYNDLLDYISSTTASQWYNVEGDDVKDWLKEHHSFKGCFEYGVLCGKRWFLAQHTPAVHIDNVSKAFDEAQDIAKSSIIHNEYHENMLMDRRINGSWSYGFFVGVEVESARSYHLDDDNHTITIPNDEQMLKFLDIYRRLFGNLPCNDIEAIDKIKKAW